MMIDAHSLRSPSLAEFAHCEYAVNAIERARERMNEREWDNDFNERMEEMRYASVCFLWNNFAFFIRALFRIK